MVMLYFSGTGNSKYIAQSFGKIMSSPCHSIEESIDFDTLISSSDTVAVCYPVYGSRVPRIMREFASAYQSALKGKRLIIFCTQMGFSGDGARAFMDLLPAGHCNTIYAEHFFMPNNICNLFIFPITKDRINRFYLWLSDRRMARTCKNISSGKVRKRGFNPFSRLLGLMQGAFLDQWEEPAKRKVWIDDECNHCGLCESICPMKNLKTEQGKIVPQNNCTLCYRCINACPQRAIALYVKTKVKKQYKGIKHLRD